MPTRYRFKRKPGTGNHWYRDPATDQERLVEVGEVILISTIDELGAGADKFEQIDPFPEGQEEGPVPTVSLEVVHREKGWYDVVNPATRETINDKALREREAHELAGIPVPTENDDPNPARDNYTGASGTETPQEEGDQDDAAETPAVENPPDLG